MSPEKCVSVSALIVISIIIYGTACAGDNLNTRKVSVTVPERILTLSGTLIQKNGAPVENIKVYAQKAYFPDNDRNRVRTEFTTNEQGNLSMPFGITDKQGNFSVKYSLDTFHPIFALSLRHGRASLDFPVIKVFELKQERWSTNNNISINVGEVSPPEGWDIVHFEKGNY